MSNNVQWKVYKLVLALLVILILFSIGSGLLVRKIGIPGLFEIEFGEKSSTSQLPPERQPLQAPTDRVRSEKSPVSQLEPGTPPSAMAMEIRSDPSSADTYLDWKPQGQTPVSLKGTDISGLIVVVKEGYRAAFRRIDAREKSQVKFALLPDLTRSRARLLLLAHENTSDDALSSLRSQLVGEGFTLLGTEEARGFQQELSRAGGLSHRGLRGWARERFNTDLLLLARFRQSSRELSDQEVGHLGIREAVKGIVRTEVGVDLEAVDLRSGDHLGIVSGKGSGFALERAQALQKAMTQAITESAQLLRNKIEAKVFPRIEPTQSLHYQQDKRTSEQYPLPERSPQ